MTTVLNFTRDTLEQLRKQHATAIAENKDVFTFNEDQGQFKPILKHMLDTRYAGYLIEHLDNEFAKHPDQPARPNNEGQEGQ